MCTSREEILGKGLPSLAQSIISKCSRTWSQERRVSVLHRTLKPRISVWDCVPEHIVDIQLRDTFDILPEQRNYLLEHANPASAVVRSIRRLDGHQSCPLVLNSPRFDSAGEVDADHCAQGSDFTLEVSESDSADDRIISRESTPSPAAISEYKDDETHSTPLLLELEEESDRGKPEQGNSYSETENVVFCSSTEQSDSDVDDEAFSTEPREVSTIEDSDADVENYPKDDKPAEADSPEPREPFTIEESEEGVEDDQKYDEPAEANSPEPRELFTIEESDEDAEDDQKYDEPAETNSPKPRELFKIHECDEDVEDDQQCDEPAEANSPEPRELFTIHECDEDVEDHQQCDEPAEANSPEPRELFTIHECDEDVEDDQQCDEPAEATSTELLQLSPVHQSYQEFDSTHWNDEPLEAESIEPRRLSHYRIESPVSYYDGDEKDDDSSRAESPPPRGLFPAHQSHSILYDSPQPAPQTGTYCPAPLRRFLESEERLKFDAFNDWFVQMHMNRHAAIDTNPEKTNSGTPSPENCRLFQFRQTSPARDDEKDDDSSRTESPAPRRLFPVHQSHPTVYDPPQSALQMESYCPAPLRQFLEPKERLKFDAFNDWFVQMHMNRHTAIDTNPEKSNSGTPSPENCRLFPFRQTSPVPTYGDDEKDDDSSRAESPAPRRLFPVHQSHPRVYDPPQSAPQMESYCPAPLRRFLEPEERLKFDAFNDRFVEMHMSRHNAIDAGPEPRELSPCRRESPVGEHDGDEKDDDSSRAESPAPRRLFPVHRSYSTVYDPPQSAPQKETFCPAPLRRFLEPEERLKFDAFNDWYVQMHMNRHTAIDTNPEKSIPGTPSPENCRLFQFRQTSPVPKYNDDEKDDDSSRAESPAPRRLFPVHQSHPTVYDPPQSAPQMGTYCPAPLRRFLEPEERLKFDAFNDRFVEMHMSRHTGIDSNPEKSIPGRPSPEHCRLIQFRHTSPVPTCGEDERDDDSSRAESPAPRRLFPVHQSHPTVYDPPQSAPQMETYCPAPLRRFLKPEERLRFDAFEDCFVRMHMSRHTAIDASPEPRRLDPLRHESPGPKCDNNEKYHESFEVESHEPRRFFPVRQSHSWLNEPNPGLERDDDALERMELIPVESLRL